MFFVDPDENENAPVKEAFQCGDRKRLLFMVQLLGLILRLKADVDAELFK